MYFINVSLAKNKIISFLLTIASMYLLKPYIAARAQLVTFILFILTLYFIEKFLQTGKKRYAIGLIIIPILIANIHLAVFPFYFILYLPYIAEYGIYLLMNWQPISIKHRIKKLKKKLVQVENKEEIETRIKELEQEEEKEVEQVKSKNKNAYKIQVGHSKYIVPLIIIMLICIFTGLLTPLKSTPYTYLIKTMQGNTTHNINEHLPLTLINNMNFMILLTCYIIIIAFTKNRIKLSHLFLLGGLIFLAFMSRRQISLVILLGSIILNIWITNLINRKDKNMTNKVEELFINPIGIALITLVIVIASIVLYKPIKGTPYISKELYPVEASEWILNNLDVKDIKLYNEYNYGSYLLFKGIPVFIDSRADLYSPEFNKGVNIFTDFLKLNNLNTSKINEKIDEYEFTHFIVKNKTRLKIYLDQDVLRYTEIYHDDNFTIYRKVI